MAIVDANEPNCAGKVYHRPDTWKYDFDIVDDQCNAVQTWGNKTKCKAVVEDVDVHFCRKNLFGELDLCDKDKEAKNDRKYYSEH